MGKYDSVVNLVQKTQAYLRASGKSNMLLTRAPKDVNIRGLRFAGKTVGDVCSFRGDRTLCPAFLDELMKLDDADNIKFATAVKDRMLMAMGYSSPEKIKVLSEANPAFNMTFNWANGTLKVGDLSGFSKAEKIVGLRHELDHFDRAAQLYKAIGGKRQNRSKIGYTCNYWCRRPRSLGNSAA